MTSQQSKEQLHALFGPVFYEFYGSTEMGINTVLRPEHVAIKPNSCGRVVPGMELGVFDDQFRRLGPNEAGELYVRRYDGMFEGYYGDDEKTSKSTYMGGKGTTAN